MKRSRFAEEQILYALKKVAAGAPVADVCRQMGISEATFYVWKKRYGNLALLEVRELRQLRDENARLKRLVADLALDRHILQEVVKKRSDHGQSSRHRSMDTELFPAQLPPVALADPSQVRDLVLPFASARQQRPSAETAGTGDGSAALRLRALAHPARTGGLARRPQP
jgi:putative transposase